MTAAGLKAAAWRLVPKRKDVIGAVLRLAVAGALAVVAVVLANATMLIAAKVFAVMGAYGLLYQTEKAGQGLVVEVLEKLFARRRPDDDLWSGGV